MKKIFDLELKKVYISGPMTGLENLNFDKFEEAEEKLKKFNFEIFNPHKLSEFKTEEFKELIKDQKSHIVWEHYMKVDIQIMLRECEFLVVLPGWEHSRGATMEIFIAKSLGMIVIDYNTLEELNVDFKLTKIFGYEKGN